VHTHRPRDNINLTLIRMRGSFWRKHEPQNNRTFILYLNCPFSLIPCSFIPLCFSCSAFCIFDLILSLHLPVGLTSLSLYHFIFWMTTIFLYELGSSGNTVMRLGRGQWKNRGSVLASGITLLATESELALGAPKSPFQWVPGLISLVMCQDTYHSLPSSTKD